MKHYSGGAHSQKTPPLPHSSVVLRTKCLSSPHWFVSCKKLGTNFVAVSVILHICCKNNPKSHVVLGSRQEIFRAINIGSLYFATGS